jgi:glycosyltransferase involved in cell wall biosynthesis
MIKKLFKGNLHIHYLSKKTNTFLYNPRFQYAIAKNFPILDKEHNFDLIHANHAHMSDLLLKFKHVSVPSLTTVHSTIDSQRLGTKNSGIGLRNFEQSEKFTYLLYPVLKLAERYYLDNVDNAIFVSNYIRDLVKQTYSVSFDFEGVIPNGVDTDRFCPEIKNKSNEMFDELAKLNAPIVLFTGRLIALKGVYVLIDAIKEILKKHPEAHFVFAGSGEISSLLPALKSDGLMRKKCTFLGQVEHWKMPHLYALSSIYILPSFSESSPLGILEAMSSGIPVISTSVGGVSEIIDNNVNGILIEPGNKRAITERINYLLDNESEMKRLGQRAREYIIDSRSMSKVVEKTFNSYLKVLDNNQ